ncbi:hypothetical protein PV325_012469, partial [Microctonus aethiopoides]
TLRTKIKGVKKNSKLLRGCISVKNGRIDNKKKTIFKLEDSSIQSMGMGKFFRAMPIHGSDNLFIQLQFPLLKTTVRPFVSEISSPSHRKCRFPALEDEDFDTSCKCDQIAVVTLWAKFDEIVQ